jgi:hypothetical protein
LTTTEVKSQAIPIPIRPAIPIASAAAAKKRSTTAAAMGVMGRLRIFVVQEPVVAASCLIAGFGTLCSQSRLPRESFSLSLVYA